jgi:glycerol-3-phosphate acyltransferase PlsX
VAAVTEPGSAEAPVAIDAMGSDGAPAPEVAAALACRARGQAVTLVGEREALTGAGAPPPIDVVDAPHRVSMADEPAMALRRNPQASVRVAARLVAHGRAGALVSAGSTGAIIGAALLELGRVPGVRRPAVSARLPVPGTDGVILIDAGGTPDAGVAAMVGFARMGVALAAGDDGPVPPDTRGPGPVPRVGLLNVGAEPGRGNRAVRGAHVALAHMEGFIGNVEPADVLAGVADVVVADAFTGNVLLKTIEAMATAAGLDRHGDAGALLLGVRAPIVVAHGSAEAATLEAAVGAAAHAAASGVSARVADRVASRAQTVGSGTPR